MVVEWTDSALAAMYMTLDYTYSHYGQLQADKLNAEFQRIGERIAAFPRMGSLEPELAHRDEEFRYILIFKILKVVYCIDRPDHISIITVWDSRKTPKDIEPALFGSVN